LELLPSWSTKNNDKNRGRQANSVTSLDVHLIVSVIPREIIPTLFPLQETILQLRTKCDFQSDITKLAFMQSHRLLMAVVQLAAAYSAVTAEVTDPQVRWIVSLPHAGWLGFHLSKMGQLVKIVVQDGATGDSIPFARSYDGRPFEVAPGPYAHGEVPLDCSAETQLCEIDITVVQQRGSLLEITYSSYHDANSEKGRNAMVARFLEQATYVHRSFIPWAMKSRYAQK
jgi:hypothetical protein